MKNEKLNFKEHLIARIKRYKEAGLITKKPFKGSIKAADVLVFQLNRGAITNNGATPWWIQATIGTNPTSPQTFKFMADTGTIDTWVTCKYTGL